MVAVGIQAAELKTGFKAGIEQFISAYNQEKCYQLLKSKKTGIRITYEPYFEFDFLLLKIFGHTVSFGKNKHFCCMCLTA